MNDKQQTTNTLKNNYFSVSIENCDVEGMTAFLCAYKHFIDQFYAEWMNAAHIHMEIDEWMSRP